jgi:hypothetical protein
LLAILAKKFTPAKEKRVRKAVRRVGVWFGRNSADRWLSPGFSPTNPYSGRGVDRSLPRYFDNARNSAVITAQTVCMPRSSGPVSQQQLRKNPVTGLVEHDNSVPPRTFTDASRMSFSLPRYLPGWPRHRDKHRLSS